MFDGLFKINVRKKMEEDLADAERQLYLHTVERDRLDHMVSMYKSRVQMLKAMSEAGQVVVQTQQDA